MTKIMKIMDPSPQFIFDLIIKDWFFWGGVLRKSRTT